jgi:hypothetical protein
MFTSQYALIPGSTNTVELRGLRFADGEREPVESPTVLVTIFGPDNKPIPGESWPKTMTRVTGTFLDDDGVDIPRYRGRIAPSAAIHRNRAYRLEVTVDSLDASRRIFATMLQAQDSIS